MCAGLVLLHGTEFSLLVFSQDKPGSRVPAGIQGRLQNPVSRQEEQMSEGRKTVIMVRLHAEAADTKLKGEGL